MTAARSLPILATLAALGATVPSVAAEVAPPADRCDFRAWSKDPDPAGLDVRTAPRADATVIARLPPPRVVDGEKLAVEFHVLGGTGGWLLIEKAEYGDYGTGAKKVFSGRGWVAASLVDVGVQDEKVRVGPTTGASLVDEPHPAGDGNDEFLSLGRILGCRDHWIEMEGEFRVEQKKPGRPVRGWVTGLCGNQVTTCN
ncbi:SH3 domain-containing protein [Pinisolibacter sp.]|uniref:SH3 domain-containing protein n=1 Tax=Pinisolibacter sp. TaxID=2172024 RepID=UPI002FDF08E3